MSQWSRFYAQANVGDYVRVWRRKEDMGEAVITAKANPATDQIIRFKYTKDNRYDSINAYRVDYHLTIGVTPLPNPMDPRPALDNPTR